MDQSWEAILNRALEGTPVTFDEALVLGASGAETLPQLMAGACKLRESFRGDAVSLCAIINAKSGRCSEDCGFCAQSTRFQTGTASYPLIPEETILKGSEQSAREGVSFFCIVTSGKRATAQELEKIGATLRRMRDAGQVRPCASLGTLDREELAALKAAGLIRYHHNIETARSYYASVCTTHGYDDRLQTVLRAKEAGLQICCGGIIGMGETLNQRIEMAVALRELEVTSIPINILNPIEGTPLFGTDALSREEILKTFALFRIINPSAEIRACAGREVNLRDEQGKLLDAGIDGLLTGDYLTTTGTSPEKDRDMIAARGLKLGPPSTSS
ncbi:MAG: biotin synthase BioB [bacterium]|nr:biotin synthase BioB [bacterium]